MKCLSCLICVRSGHDFVLGTGGALDCVSGRRGYPQMRANLDQQRPWCV